MINNKKKDIIGRAEEAVFSDLKQKKVHARIDSGARTSAIWGSAKINDDNNLVVSFFGEKDQYIFTQYARQVVATSTGHTETRFTIKLSVIVKGRKIRATFTIANRSSQVYPVLIGRNILRGKFVVDVQTGKTLKAVEKKRIASLQRLLTKEGL